MNRRKFGQLAVGAGLASALSLQESRGSVLSGAFSSDAGAFPEAASVAPPASGAVRFSDMIWTLEKIAPFDRCLEIVAEAGYQGVELTGQWRKWTPADTQRYQAKMHSLGLVVDVLSAVRVGFADPKAGDAFQAAIKEQIDFCKQFQTPQINLRSGNVIEGVDRGVQRTAAIENLKHAAELAAAANIEILIEPVDGLEAPKEYLTTVTEGFEIVRAVGSPQVKVLYDFYHEQRQYGNLIEKLEKNIDLVGLVHIADVPGRHEPGTGEIDYGNIYKKLAELKYSRFITMEFYPTGEPVAALKKARLDALAAMGQG